MNTSSYWQSIISIFVIANLVVVLGICVNIKK